VANKQVTNKFLFSSLVMDFNFRLGSLDLEGSDELLTDPPVRFSSPLDPDTPIAVGRLSTVSGTSTALFPSPMSSASIGTGGVKSTVEVGLLYSESVFVHYATLRP
jgi:hypothetical protein